MNTSIILDVKGLMNKIETKTGKLQWKYVQGDSSAFFIRTSIPEHISVTEFHHEHITGEGYSINVIVGKSSMYITVQQEEQVNNDVIVDNLCL